MAVKFFNECSFPKVIGVVASGAGPVAVGWLGWKGYVKNCTPIVQVNVSERRQAKIVSIDAEYLEDCAAVDEVKNVDPKGDEKVAAIAKKYPTTWIKLSYLDHEPVCAPPLFAVCTGAQSVDSATMFLEDIATISYEDTSYCTNKTHWNVSFQRQHLMQLRHSLEQQAIGEKPAR
ncbi:hypothetical protein OUZ56_021361 [Daphnia magna]|uniref:Uncharacterized protein n=1 Tax=Daphnia magna TaxID=35525 RepID=A0ABQ9ZH62_9CRUS|nr:hypothetical protein OUZ56_021361 [Daphnia magna]